MKNHDREDGQSNGSKVRKIFILIAESHNKINLVIYLFEQDLFFRFNIYRLVTLLLK